MRNVEVTLTLVAFFFFFLICGCLQEYWPEVTYRCVGSGRRLKGYKTHPPIFLCFSSKAYADDFYGAMLGVSERSPLTLSLKLWKCGWRYLSNLQKSLEIMSVYYIHIYPQTHF